jgi:hypothetical protein
MSQEIKVRVGRWQINHTPGHQYAEICHIMQPEIACDCLNYLYGNAEEIYAPNREELKKDLAEWVRDNGAIYEAEGLPL